MRLAEVIVCEVQGDRSFKVFQLLTESVGQTGESAAMHPQRMILLFDMRRANRVHVRHAANQSLLGLNHFCGTVPACRVLVEITD